MERVMGRAAGGHSEKCVGGPPGRALPLSTGCRGDRSVRVSGGLPSVGELPLQLLWQQGQIPPCSHPVRRFKRAGGALHINGLLAPSPHQLPKRW